MTGNGTPTDLQGPLARMWRDVYAKAAGVAEGRTTQLLKQHVYHYPHGAGGEGGGGGGGGLVELGRAVATAGQRDLRVPATGSLPTGYSGLYIVATGRNDHATVNQNSDVYLFYNDEVDFAKYNFGYVNAQLSTNLAAGGSPSVGAIQVGYAPSYDPAGPQSVYSLSGWVPLHEQTALPKAGQFLAVGVRGTAGELPSTRTTMGVYTPNPAAPITSVSLRCGLFWRAGATLIVYGHGPATGDGGGGGGAEVTITTDASLTVAEAPANTFALAARLSPDAGNALSLHANGLFATDTGSGGGTAEVTITGDNGIGVVESPANTFSLATRVSGSAGNSLVLQAGGLFVPDFLTQAEGDARYAPIGSGGGTGNTTMHTQTTAPTGAENSLWFNPSESA